MRRFPRGTLGSKLSKVWDAMTDNFSGTELLAVFYFNAVVRWLLPAGWQMVQIKIILIYDTCSAVFELFVSISVVSIISRCGN